MTKEIPKLDWQLDDLVLFVHLQERMWRLPHQTIHFSSSRWSSVQEFMKAIGLEPQKNGTYKYLGSVIEGPSKNA